MIFSRVVVLGEITSFLHFFSTCFEILSWNIVYGFVVMSNRSSSRFVSFRLILNELCPFLDIVYRNNSSALFMSCFKVLSWNFVYGFVVISYRSCLWFVRRRQILNELCPFLHLEYYRAEGMCIRPAVPLFLSSRELDIVATIWNFGWVSCTRPMAMSKVKVTLGGQSQNFVTYTFTSYCCIFRILLLFSAHDEAFIVPRAEFRETDEVI